MDFFNPAKINELADKLDNKIYPMLLFTVAIIPLQQVLTATCVNITFLCALFVVVVKGRQMPKVLKKWQQYLLYALLGLSWVSNFLSKDMLLSSYNYLYVVGQYASFIFVLLRYGWSEQDDYQLDFSYRDLLSWERFSRLPRPLQLLLAFLGMSFIVSSIGILQKVLGVAAEGIWVDPDQFPDLKFRAYSTLVNPNILAGYLVLAVAFAAPFSHYLKWYDEWRKPRYGFLALGLWAALCLLYTYSRGNWIACAVVLLCFCIFFYRKAMWSVLGVGVAGMLIGGSAVLHRLRSITNGEDTSAALRLAYLESTEYIIKDFPWGVGWYGYRFVYPDYNFYLDDKSVIMYHCHNLFLNTLAELGPQGFTAFLLVWGMFFVAGWKLARKATEPWLQALGSGYVLASFGMAVGGLTDHIYFNTQMGLLFWTLGTITLICWNRTAKSV